MILYKFRSFNNFEHLIDILVNERLYCPIYRNMNDPFEGLFYSALSFNNGLFSHMLSDGSKITIKKHRSVDELFTNLEDVRVCSLSSSFSDVRLWSHYGDAHRGVAIAIDFSGLEDQINKVQYTAGLPKFGNTLLTDPNPRDVLSCKTSHWDYESEYRIINCGEYFSVADRIKAVYTGPKIKTDRHKLLESILNGRTPVIPTSINKDKVIVEAITTG